VNGEKGAFRDADAAFAPLAESVKGCFHLCLKGCGAFQAPGAVFST